LTVNITTVKNVTVTTHTLTVGGDTEQSSQQTFIVSWLQMRNHGDVTTRTTSKVNRHLGNEPVVTMHNYPLTDFC